LYDEIRPNMNFFQPDSVVDKELVKTVESKLVESVIESRSGLTPTAVLWIGETTDGYFRVFLIAGSLMVLWSEREYVIKYGLKAWLCVGITEQTLNLLKSGLDDVFIKNINDLNTFTNMADDVRNTEFSDIMKLLKWEYKNKEVKIEFDELNVIPL